MAYVNVYNDFIFIEGDEPNATTISPVEYDKYSHRFYNQQLLTLNDIKDQLIVKAKQLGANAIIKFTYGQKSTGWFRSFLLSFDDNVNWYANGLAVRLPIDREQEIKEKFKNQ